MMIAVIELQQQELSEAQDELFKLAQIPHEPSECQSLLDRIDDLNAEMQETRRRIDAEMATWEDEPVVGSQMYNFVKGVS